MSTIKNNVKIAIVGGGIAGSSIAIYLGKLGLNVTLFEKNDSIVSGPPICHLHAGGNLYREISNTQCITLLKESIDLLKLYPNSIDYRPTVLAVPKEDGGKPEDIYDRLELLKIEYKKLIKQDNSNEVLCSSDDYFKIYDKETVEYLKTKDIVKNPSNFDEWMIPVAKNLDFEKLKFPLIMVQEYGLNIFRLSASAVLMLENINTAKLLTNTKVTNIIEDKVKDGYIVEYENNDQLKQEHYDYLINSAGFRTGTIDDMLGFKKDRLVEFKSAYVTKWENCSDIWPEVIFFGQRGTPQGMGQFTPYPNGHFQIHGMTESITLFKDGLVKNCSLSAQPKLEQKFIDKIDKSWSTTEIEERTNRSIEHIKQYIPNFKDVKVASKPLYGAQQIPGSDSSLRTADVSFENSRYARCEIVKASSVLTMSDLIVEQLINLEYLDKDVQNTREFLYDFNFDNEKITKIAKELCKERDYPIDLGYTNTSVNRCNKI